MTNAGILGLGIYLPPDIRTVVKMRITRSGEGGQR